MPTGKQKALAKKLSENVGMPMGQAMREVGYSKSTSETPQRVTDTKGWKELKEKYREALLASGLDHIKLQQKMAEWIDAVKISTSLTEPDRITPDYQTQLKAGEMLREDLEIKESKTQVNVLNQGDLNMGLLINEQKD